MFSLESPQRGDSYEYTHHTIFIIQNNNLRLSQIYSYGIFSNGLNNEFEVAVVNEPSVFEPLKFYCNFVCFCMALNFLIKLSLLLSIFSGSIS